MKIIACYSRGTSYEREAQILRASLDRAGMRAHYIIGFDDRGDWYRNTSYKAQFIADMRASMRGPLLYLDVDAFVHENCTLYFQKLALRGYDFGAHFFAGPRKGHDFRRSCRCLRGEPCTRDHWMLSGTLFLNDTEPCQRLVRTWAAMNDVLQSAGLTTGGGQKNLWFLTTCMDDLKVQRLPGRYTYVFDKAKGYPKDEPCIIEHTIASRENRGSSKGRTNRARTERIEELRELVMV